MDLSSSLSVSTSAELSSTARSAVPAAAKRAAVALLRGPYVSQFEMQTFEKLLPDFDLTAWLLTINRFPVELISVPIRRILCIDEPFARISGKLGFYFNLLLQASCGLDYWHLGLVNKLAGTEIVHTMETFNAYSWQGLLAKRRHGCKLVTTVFENRPFAAERFAAKRRMKAEVLREADMHIALTERARACLLLEGADPARVEVIPMGVDIERFHPGSAPGLRQRLGIGEEELVLLSVATLRWEKGVYDLLHALKALSLEPSLHHRPLRLILAGSGPEAARLRGLADRIGLGERLLITRFGYDEMPEAYRAADVFVLASTARKGWLEQLGYVLLEAMASGLPIVSTRSGSIPEVLGNAALLCLPSDFLDLSQTLTRLLNDDALAADLGLAARARAEQLFDSRLIAGRIAQVYRSLG